MACGKHELPSAAALHITIPLGTPAPKRVAVRADHPGAPWQELERAGMEYRGARPAEPYLVQIDCAHETTVIALGDRDAYAIHTACSVADAEVRQVLVAGGDHTLRDIVGPSGSGREGVGIPWVGAWDVVALDDADRIAIARHVSVPHPAALDLGAFAALAPGEIEVTNPPASGSWDAGVRLRTAGGTTVALPPTTRIGDDVHRVTVAMPPAQMLARGDTVSRYVSTCRAHPWCVSATTTEGAALTLPAVPAAPVPRVTGASLALALPDGTRAYDLVDLALEPAGDDGAPMRVLMTRAWLAARAPGTSLLVPAADAGRWRHLTVELLELTAPISALPLDAASLRQATISFDLP